MLPEDEKKMYMLKEKLNGLLSSDNYNKDEALKLSQELDKLIVKAQRQKIRH